MKVRNRRESAVTIAPAQGPRIHVEAGAEVDVPDALAESLLDQPDRWAPAGPTSVETTVSAVLAQVGDSKQRAQTALDREQQAENPRSTLVDALTKIIESEED